MKKPRRASASYTNFELTARECRELCEALSLAAVHGTVAEPRARRLFLLFEPFAAPPPKKKSLLR